MGQKLRGWGKISKNPPQKKVFRRKKSYSYRKGYLTKEDIRLKAKKPPLLKMLK